MGQKVNPVGFRVGINRTWDSRWYSDKNYTKKLQEDLEIKKFVRQKLKGASVSKLIIERSADVLRLTVFSAKPGVVIGKKGSDLEAIKKKIAKITKDEVKINIVEVKKPELDAQIVADNVAQQLERRITFRRAMKRAVQSTMRYDALGIRISCSGRLNGVDIARTEWYREGRVPLHTLRADVDYATSEANTTYGVIGVKTWIYKGDLSTNDPYAHEKRVRGILKDIPKENATA